MSSLIANLTAFAYLAGWRLVRLLPERLAYRLFDVIADVAWRAQGTGVRQLEANLRRVCPAADPDELRSLSRNGMRSYLRYWCDSFRLPGWSPQRISETVRVVGDEPVRAALARGQGVVMFLGHLGNWDLAGAWCTLHLAPVTTVAEHLRPQRLFQQFTRFREQLGMRIIPLSDGPGVLRVLLRTLRDGGFVPLLAERDLTDGGVEVEFFGEPARMALGPAALAQGSGAALFAASIHYERLPGQRRHGIVITWLPQIDTTDVGTGRAAITQLTQRCADRLADAIRAHPQDWHMLQPVFLADLAAA